MYNRKAIEKQYNMVRTGDVKRLSPFPQPPKQRRWLRISDNSYARRFQLGTNGAMEEKNNLEATV